MSGNAQGGNVSINSDTFALSSGASLLSAAGLDFTAPDFVVSGTGGGGDILVTATDTVTISGVNLDLFASSNISTQTYNPVVDQALDQGQGGAITVSAPNIILEDAGKIGSTTQGKGVGGDVNIFASNHLSVSGFSQDLGAASSIISSSSGTPSGNGGAIQVTAPSVTIEDGGRIATDKSSVGNGGDIALTVDDLTLRNGGSITSSSSSDGSSGHIQITATGTLTMSGQFFDPNNPGSGGWSVINNKTDGVSSLNGGIDIHAGKLIMKDGPLNALNQDVGQIESETGASAGGTVRIIADDFISMSSGANIINRKGSFESGSITLTAPFITLSQSTIQGRTNIERDAGAITLNATAGNLTLSNDSHVLTSTLQSSGKAGPIVAEASDSILLSGGSTIESSSSPVATGDGGLITLTAANQVTLTGTRTALRSTTAGSGDGGTVTVTAGQSVNLNDGASISASSTGTGNAGNISINAGQQFEMRNSSVKTEAAQASGGNIDIQAVNRVRLVNSTISTSVLGGAGSGGNITIDPNIVVLQNSNVIAQAVQGAGGNITIFTPLFLADSSSLVSASSQFGLNGTVTIQSPTSNLSGSLGTLPSNPSQAHSLLTQRCAALANSQASSFVVAGREQLPTDPEGWLTSPLALAGIDADPFTEGTVANIPATMDPHDTGTVSLRRLTPSGFLIANFADSEATGCHS
jgi:large exoprotein involved in heme utilization and adhesion